MGTMTLELATDHVTEQPRILIADDQPEVLEALRLLLKGHGYFTEAVGSPAALIEAVGRSEYDVVLMDLNYARDTTSGREGLDLLARLKANNETPPIVVMTGWATVGLAVEAMQRGVGDFVEKPWENARLLGILKTQIQLGRELRRRAKEESSEQRKIALQLHEQEREIQDARAIQQGFLPKEIPELCGFAIAAAWQPAHVVGGDYYDFLNLGEEKLGICIADVAGKGMPAALLMSNLQAAVRGLAAPKLAPGDFCEKLNSVVRQNIASDRFVSLFYAELDAPGRRLRYVNAGSNAPIVLHHDGSCDRLQEGGGVLGIFDSPKYAMGITELAAGDRVICFTDGVTEAHNPDGEEFGEERLLRVAEENRNAGAAELQRSIIRAAENFCRGVWDDDATLIVVAVE